MSVQNVAMWGAKPEAADPADSLAQASAVVSLLHGAAEVPASACQQLIDVQTELLSKLGRLAWPASMRHAELAAQQVAILVTQVEVPARTLDVLKAARVSLEDVQLTEVGTPAAASIGTSPMKAGSPSPPKPAGGAPSDANGVPGLGVEEIDLESIGDQELVMFVVDKVAGGAAAFKANKLQQILAALVREEV